MPQDVCAIVPASRGPGCLPSFLTRELIDAWLGVDSIASGLTSRSCSAAPSVDTHTLSDEERTAAVDFRLNLLGMFGGLEEHKWDQCQT